jgi:4-amino-4-deoxy-L-arabinose transferase-like glycosyltransferase
MATVTPARPSTGQPDYSASRPRTSPWRRVLFGPATAPQWARPALFGLLAVTAFFYLWDLSASGWANSFYAAAVEAGSKSWKAAFFGSFDSSNFITVDKPPAALWVMDISARIFGFNSWSLLVPQAIEGVATVALIYAAVRRWFGEAAGLVAGAIIALTPVAALMFRYDNPDSLLLLLLVAAAYCMVRAVDSGKTRWLVLAGALVGGGFLTKMLQALLVVPAFGLVYLVSGPRSWGRRIVQLLASGVVLVVSALWWVVVVMAIPAADRPYIGGSTDNSLWNLIFGYNGFGRLTGNETGSVGGGGGGTGTGLWGPTGLTRLFNSDFGGDISWLLPAALVLLLAGLAVTWRAPRQDRTRAAALLWGGWLVVTGLVFSLSKGIIHPYYTVALAPAIGAIVGIGVAVLWTRRAAGTARAVAAIALAATVVWSYVLLDRSASWYPWLRYGELVAGLALALLVVVGPGLVRRLYLMGGRGAANALHARGGVWLASAVVVVALAGPAAYTVDTVTTPHSGAIPTAGPSVAGSFGPGGGGFGGGSLRGGGGKGNFPATAGGRAAFGGSPGAAPGGFGGGSRSATRSGKGGFGPGTGTGGFAGRGFAGRGFAGRGFAGGGGIGGLLQSGTAGKAVKADLVADASQYTWVAAIVGADNAATYQLGVSKPVMAIGGFNGTDPTPTLAAFERDVSEHKIHYFISSGGGGAGGQGGGSSDASSITAWVEAHYTAKTVDGVTLYDLSGAAKS